MIENAQNLGHFLMEKLEEIKDKHPCVGDVRGKGLFAGIDLVNNKAIVQDNENELEVNISLIESLKEGDYVLIQSGYATQSMDEKDAQETLELWKSFNQDEK